MSQSHKSQSQNAEIKIWIIQLNIVTLPKIQNNESSHTKSQSCQRHHRGHQKVRDRTRIPDSLRYLQRGYDGRCGLAGEENR